MAPFEVEVVEEADALRSRKRSDDRNALEREIRNRDLYWLLKM